jgi:hypothetical protein
VAALLENPLFAGLSVSVAATAVAATVGEMWSELVACGACVAAVAALFGKALGAPSRRGRSGFEEGIFDAALVFGALYVGIALEHPAALRHAALWPLRPLPVLAVTMALAAGVLAASAVRGRRARCPSGVVRHVAATVAVAILGWALALHGHRPAPAAARGTRVLLGLDSLSQLDPVSALKQFTLEHGGTWFERAVTPGLLTNAVWPAILTSRPPSESGIFFIYQSPDWRSFPDNLVERARGAGFETVSFFSDQFTTHVGSDAGFDLNRSGPRGWKQVSTAVVKDASILLPVMLPWLPRIPSAVTPPNQSGTYAYDLDLEISEILAAGGMGAPAFVAAHLDYLHQPRYPSYSELTVQERLRVLVAPLSALADQSMHWQYPAVPGEPLALYEWKRRRLQRAVASALEGSGFLDPDRRNQLVMFSDHGSRAGVTDLEFGREEFYRVLLVTFGVPRRDVLAPISLLDVGDLLGFPHPDRSAPTDPVVEYVNVSPEEWKTLIASSRASSDGGVQLDRKVLLDLGRRLRGFRPYTEPLGYFEAPVEAVRERVAVADGSIAARPE